MVTTEEYRTDSPVAIIQPCSEACACFRRLVAGGWSDYGLCANPNSPLHGGPVRLGRDCRNYQPRGESPEGG